MNSSAIEPLVLIIGYGNTLRSDDGVGCVVADRLATRYAEDARVVVEIRHQLLPEMAEAVARARWVMLIDAAADAPAGSVDCRRVEPETAGVGSGGLGHLTSPAGLAGAAGALYGSAGDMWITTIGGACWDHGESLSAAVSAAADRAGTLIAAWVDDWLRRASHA